MGREEATKLAVLADPPVIDALLEHHDEILRLERELTRRACVVRFDHHGAREAPRLVLLGLGSGTA